MRPGSRGWWLAAAGYVAVLFAVQPWLGFAVDTLKERWGERAFALGVTGAAVLGGAALALAAVRLLRSATAGEIALLALVAALYGVGVASLSIPQERLHYLEYGLLAAILYAGVAARGDHWPGWRAGLAALAATVFLGWLDETIQGAFWERRYFDWRDVELNGRAAVLGVLAAYPLFRAWRRQSRVQDASAGAARPPAPPR